MRFNFLPCTFFFSKDVNLHLLSKDNAKLFGLTDSEYFLQCKTGNKICLDVSGTRLQPVSAVYRICKMLKMC